MKRSIRVLATGLTKDPTQARVFGHDAGLRTGFKQPNVVGISNVAGSRAKGRRDLTRSKVWSTSLGRKQGTRLGHHLGSEGNVDVNNDSAYVNQLTTSRTNRESDGSEGEEEG
jgi:hypothetical protein